MSKDEITKFLSRDVPQSEQVNQLQVQNSAGGWSFPDTPGTQLERFLIMGSANGTYYVEETDLTKLNFIVLEELTRISPKFVVDKAVEISKSGRAYRNNTAIFTLAYVLTFANDEGKSYARLSVNDVVRTGTHLFTFHKYLELLAPGTGLGTSRVRAIGSWFDEKTTDVLGYQMAKYRARDGVTYRELLRRSRPRNVDENLAAWALGKDHNYDSLPEPVRVFEQLQKAASEDEVIGIMNANPGLVVWEYLPTQFHKSEKVWKTLFYTGMLEGQALIRNITRLARIGAFKDLVFARDYATKITDRTMIRRTRTHPIQFLNAAVIHAEGQIIRKRERYDRTDTPFRSDNRKMDWIPSQIIQDALDEGFKLAFDYAEPSGKRTLVGVDVSGSMSWNAASGIDLSCAQVSGVMAMAIANSTPYYQIMGFSKQFVDLGITPKMSLQSAMRAVQSANFGGTDCALPMLWAQKNGIEIDTFVVITDNETWAGNVHPHRALKDYRQKMGIPARLIVVGAASNGFTIADPSDAGMMDVVGCDSNLPRLITEFSTGRI